MGWSAGRGLVAMTPEESRQESERMMAWMRALEWQQEAEGET
jgi:hypothetical protein